MQAFEPSLSFHYGFLLNFILINIGTSCPVKNFFALISLLKMLYCLFTVKEVRKIVCAKSSSVGRAIESMIRTGKLNTLSSLDLPQVYFYHYSF